MSEDSKNKAGEKPVAPAEEERLERRLLVFRAATILNSAVASSIPRRARAQDVD